MSSITIGDGSTGRQHPDVTIRGLIDNADDGRRGVSSAHTLRANWNTTLTIPQIALSEGNHTLRSFD